MDDNSKLGNEEQIFIYLLFVVGLTIVTTLLSSIILYVFWNCWPLERIGFSSCLVTLVPPPFQFFPIFLGLTFGVLLANHFIRNHNNK
jgi:hypothetical protein